MQRGGRNGGWCCGKSDAQAMGASVGDRPINLHVRHFHDVGGKMHSCSGLCARAAQWTTAELHVEKVLSHSVLLNHSSLYFRFCYT